MGVPSPVFASVRPLPSGLEEAFLLCLKNLLVGCCVVAKRKYACFELAPPIEVELSDICRMIVPVGQKNRERRLQLPQVKKKGILFIFGTLHKNLTLAFLI